MPVVRGVARSIEGTDLLSAAPVEATLTLGSDRLRAETEDVEFSGEIELPAADGAPCLGSMLAMPSSPRTRTFSSDPLFPREMLRAVVVALVVPTPVPVAADAVPPVAAAAPSKAASEMTAPSILVLRMVLPRSTENTINPYFLP